MLNNLIFFFFSSACYLVEILQHLAYQNRSCPPRTNIRAYFGAKYNYVFVLGWSLKKIHFRNAFDLCSYLKTKLNITNTGISSTIFTQFKWLTVNAWQNTVMTWYRCFCCFCIAFSSTCWDCHDGETSIKLTTIENCLFSVGKGGVHLKKRERVIISLRTFKVCRHLVT